MPIPPELAKYPNEAAFRDQLLIPLLQRLGFSLVVNYHGNREFGRDIVFAEVDRFSHVVYHALQAKFEPSISLNAAEDLIRDAKQAFNNPFRHPQTGSDHRISVFYAVNAGGISEQGRDHFFNSLQPRYGGNVRLIEGPGVIALDRLATVSRGNAVKERLTGLLLEIRYNRNACKFLKPYLADYERTPTNLYQRLRLQATAAVMEQPAGIDISDYMAVDQYWQMANMINSMLDSLVNAFSSSQSRAAKASLAEEKLAIVERLNDQIEDLIQIKVNEYGSSITGL